MAIQYVQYPVITIATPAGGATAAKQDTGNTSLASIDSKITAVNTGAVVVSSSALPSGASTATKQDTGNTSLASIDTKTPALVTGRVPVDGSAVTQPVSGTFWQTTQPVSAASLPLPSGASTSALQTTGNTSLSNIDGKLGSLGQKAMSGSAPVVLASDQAAIPVSQSGTWTVQPGNTANTTAWLVKASGAGTATLSNVSGSASSVSLLSSNSSRRAAAFFNDSTATLYLKFGATASTTSYTVQISTLGYYEVPQPAYTGAIDGIWSAANGAVRITEIT